MLAGFQGKSAQRIKVSAAATALHQCVQSLHMKMTVYKTSTEAKFRSKATLCRRGTEGGGTVTVWGRRGVVHEMEVCAMWWANLRVHGNVNNNKWGNLSIYFSPLYWGCQYQIGAVNLWCDFQLGEMKLFLFQVTKLAVLLYTLCTGLSLENMRQEMQICFWCFELQYICFLNFCLAHWKQKEIYPSAFADVM